jgi:hypothetical protein
MGEAKAPERVKLIASVFSGDEGRLARAESLLSIGYGPLDYQSELLQFAHTDYYTPEFGAPLVRKILAFERLIDPADLAMVKCRTNEMEWADSVGERRGVNIDPGYVSLSKLVLATTKDHVSRIYLGNGIYAEVTLRYQGGTFHPWPWTYPDYASSTYITIMNLIRRKYHQQLRAGPAGS